MRLVELLYAMFRQSGRRKKTLATVDPEEIRRERIKIEQSETRLTRAIEDLEKQKEELFQKGVGCASERQKLQVARKIKELDIQVRARDKQLTLISKNLRVLTGVAQLKENERLLQDLGMDGLVSQMDLQELQVYVEQATVQGQFQMERFTGLLESIEDAEDVYTVTDDDEETRAILAAMNRASEAGTDYSVKESLRELDESLRNQSVEEPVAQVDLA